MLSLFLIIISLPLFLLVSIIIKLESKGPIFFIQKRMGLNSKPFNLFKFRSMTVDPEAEKAGFEPGTKKRITAFGKILRKSKIDELPQLFNVLLGEMSMVGPRPEVEKYVNCYPERWKKILSVRPGITDPASVAFRNEEEILSASSTPEETYINEIMPQKMKLYEIYVENISFIGDIKILFDTFFTVLFKG